MKKATTKKILKSKKADKTVKTKTAEAKSIVRQEKISSREKEVKSLANLEAQVYDQDGKEVETIKLPENFFNVTWNADLVHQVVVSLMSNKRTNLAHTKTRGEVSGGGKKPWQQKGLGRARHGSSRSPIWVGGGVTHGPRKDKNYAKKINKKMKAKALFTIISKKFKDGEVFFLDSLKATSSKTKDAINTLKNISKIKGGEQILNKRANSAYIAVLKKDTNLDRGFKNIGNVKLDEFRNINPLDIINYKYLIIDNPVEAFKFLEAKMK